MKGYSCNENGFPQLAPADVILIRHKGSVFRYFLRKFVDAEWDHTAIVVFPRNEDGTVEHTIIAEAINERLSRTERDTVTLHRLDKYLSRPDRYEIGVRRVPALSDEERSRVVYYMIANVDAPYWGWNKLMVVCSLFSRRVTSAVQLQQPHSKGLL
jgi:Permuted papain-like amidase enzyme, YaeF/YiiX, C92 family